MCSAMRERTVVARGLVGALLPRTSTATAYVAERRAEKDDQTTVAAVTSEDRTAGKPAESMASLVRDVLGQFLVLNAQVNEFVNRYIEVFAEQPDTLTEWRLKHSIGLIDDAIGSLDRDTAILLSKSERAGTGPNDADRNALQGYSSQLRKVRRSLKPLANDAAARVATPESRQGSFEFLRTQLDTAWQATTGLFKITSRIVTQLLDQMSQWPSGAAVISEKVSSAARGPELESTVQSVTSH